MVSTATAMKNVLTRSPHEEGELAKKIEEQTAKIPSVGYLSLAIGSIVLSLGLSIFANRKEFANFVGLWGPTFLLFGIYNKLVKLEEPDAHTSPKQAA